MKNGKSLKQNKPNQKTKAKTYLYHVNKKKQSKPTTSPNGTPNNPKSPPVPLACDRAEGLGSMSKAELLSSVADQPVAFI